MKTLLRQLWIDEHGYIVSAELVVVATVFVLGLIVGMSFLQTALVGEYNDLGIAFGSLDQSYFFGGIRTRSSRCGRSAWTSGSAFIDPRQDGSIVADFAAGAVDYDRRNEGTDAVGIEEHVAAVPEADPCLDCVVISPPCNDCLPANRPYSDDAPVAARPDAPTVVAIPDPITGHYPPMAAPAPFSARNQSAGMH